MHDCDAPISPLLSHSCGCRICVIHRLARQLTPHAIYLRLIAHSFGNRPLRLRSYTTSSTSLTLYLIPSLRFRSESFFRFKI